MNKKHIIATSVAAATLLIGMPAFADSDRSDKRDWNGIHLGSITRLLDNDKRGNSYTHDWRGDKKDHKKDKGDSATSTIAVSGTVTAINSTVLTISGANSAIYTVQTASASLSSGGRAIALSEIRVGDSVKVKGTMSGTVLVATKLTDTSIYKREAIAKLENLRAGIVTSVSGNGFTMTRFGTGTAATVSTNSSTVVKVNGQATTSAAITPGSAVIVVGTTSTTTADTFAGSVVHVITKGFGWLKHFLLR